MSFQRPCHNVLNQRSLRGQNILQLKSQPSYFQTPSQHFSRKIVIHNRRRSNWCVPTLPNRSFFDTDTDHPRRHFTDQASSDITSASRLPVQHQADQAVYKHQAPSNMLEPTRKMTKHYNSPALSSLTCREARAECTDAARPTATTLLSLTCEATDPGLGRLGMPEYDHRHSHCSLHHRTQHHHQARPHHRHTQCDHLGLLDKGSWEASVGALASSTI